MFTHHVEGYALRCEVFRNLDGTYRITVLTREDLPYSVERRWEMPEHLWHRSEDEAHRWARYVCRGITHVDPWTGPAYTVY